MCFWHKVKLKRLFWSLLYFFIIFILSRTDKVCALQRGKLMIPLSHTALSGDLHVQLLLNEPPINSLTDLGLEIRKLKNNDKEKIEVINIYPDPRYNITQISIPCHIFYSGGIYEFEIIKTKPNDIEKISIDNQDNQLKEQLDVRWPSPKLSVYPEQIGTYPEEPINVVLTFPEVECKIENINDPKIPEFWLELVYCGQEITCTNTNETNPNILYVEQVRGFMKTKLIKLRCELFGLAGHYMIHLRPIQPTPSFVSAFTYITADWSEKFVFNVHARSIFPCDPHSGISVLFEYPSCILDQADRVRLFAKLRADVASLKPPTSLHYVTEQRVKRGQHALHFDCDYFTEKYIEYCFVYVSQAISGAVADIRMDCVPTLPVSDADTGGWGPWSEWTPCSTTCSGGTRNRYRFCDSPPPRYGAKFCEGPAVETQHCGQNTSNLWECFYGATSTNGSNKSSSNITAEIGSSCRCGCIVHLGIQKPKRVLASSAQSCPGRSFWLIQADNDHKIDVQIDFSRLPCSTQYVKIRDGDSLGSDLIFQNNGGTNFRSENVTSSGNQVLVEFFSDEIASIDGSCNGGFLAHVEQKLIEKFNATSITSRAIIQRPQISVKLTAVHIAAVIFTSIIIIISALLGTQYILRYRKYHLTENKGEPDSPIHTPRTSIGSLQNPESPPSRAVSTNTLLSEVIYLVKIRPKQRMKHSILRESVDAEMLEKETNFNHEKRKSRSEESNSVGSTHTLTNENINEEQNQNDKEGSLHPVNDTISINSSQSLSNSHLRIKKENEIKGKLLNNIDHNTSETLQLKRSLLSASNVTLTNGYYSPAASIISTATIRTTNQKESKEKLNRERLARPDSEFSLANQEELELDYYDYNVINAGAAPGSYLGMDPAYLVWIPPLDDGNIIHEVETNDNNEPHYEEILPRFNDLNPGSNNETPESEISATSIMYLTKKESKDIDTLKKSTITPKILACTLLNNDESLKFKNHNTASLSLKKCEKNLSDTDENIQMEDLGEKYNNQLRNAITKKTFIENSSNIEKETAVVKSPSDLQDYYELDDIQFVDDDEEERNEIIEKPKLTKNIQLNSNYSVKT